MFFGGTIIICLPYINKLEIQEEYIDDNKGFLHYAFDFVKIFQKITFIKLILKFFKLKILI